MEIKLKKELKMLGTQLKWPANTVLNATPATNQPEWESEGKISVSHPEQPKAGLLVTAQDYTIYRQ